MEGTILDPFFLDTIQAALTSILTGGYLTIRPWVVNLMTIALGATLTVGCSLMLLFPHPVTLIKVSALILRMAVLWAIMNEWNYVFDGFMNTVTWLGMRIAQSSLSNEDLLSPGNLLMIGTRLTTNLYLILLNLSDDMWYAPLLWLAYTFAWLIMWATFGVMALSMLTAVVEFQFISVFAFTMWPLMPVWFLAWIAEGLVKELIASALRLGGLAALVSIVIPFAVAVGIPGGEDELTVQSAISLGIGMAILGYVVWRGPRMLGASSWPGSGILNVGMLAWFAIRSR